MPPSVASEAEWTVRVKEWGDPGVRLEVRSLCFPFLPVDWSKCQLLASVSSSVK